MIKDILYISKDRTTTLDNFYSNVVDSYLMLMYIKIDGEYLIHCGHYGSICSLLDTIEASGDVLYQFKVEKTMNYETFKNYLLIKIRNVKIEKIIKNIEQKQ